MDWHAGDDSAGNNHRRGSGCCGRRSGRERRAAVYAGRRQSGPGDKKRFDAKVIERLLRLHIYDLPEEKLAKLHNLICGSDIDALEKAVMLEV